MNMIKVDSSAMNEVGYDSSTRTLCIRFKSGKDYNYFNVPKEVFEGLIRAHSKGTYFNNHIDGKY